jgi:GTP-binding protein
MDCIVMEALRLEKARFVLSVPDWKLLPEAKCPEIAFFGRSNVGKSSLLNYLAGQSALARVSKTPGRTQALNLFEATLQNKPMQLIDLPGHGYAKLSLKQRAELSEMISDYLANRQGLTGLVHLLDCRRDPTPEDIALSQQFRGGLEHYWAVLTKCDQLPVSKRRDTQKRFAKLLEIPVEHCFMISAFKNFGREDLLKAL